jgi:hypothetical protein
MAARGRRRCAGTADDVAYDCQRGGAPFGHSVAAERRVRLRSDGPLSLSSGAARVGWKILIREQARSLLYGKSDAPDLWAYRTVRFDAVSLHAFVSDDFPDQWEWMHCAGSPRTLEPPRMNLPLEFLVGRPPPPGP